MVEHRGVELPPCQLAAKAVVIGSEIVKQRAWVDRAEFEERRHARGAVEGWVVAAVAVVRQPTSRNRAHARCAAVSPASGNVALIVGSSGIASPAIVSHSTALAIEPGWSVPAAGNPRSVERGEHLVRIAVRLADPVGGDGVGRSGRDQRHLAECGGDALGRVARRTGRSRRRCGRRPHRSRRPPKGPPVSGRPRRSVSAAPCVPQLARPARAVCGGGRRAGDGRPSGAGRRRARTAG